MADMLLAQFDQIQVRENEIDELTAILESDHCPMEVKVSFSPSGKSFLICARAERPISMARSISCQWECTTDRYACLSLPNSLQAHISKVFVEDFALVSDAAYVAQVSILIPGLQR